MTLTGEIVKQVFMIRHEAGAGTAFTAQHEGKLYLITARHVLNGDGTAPIADPVHIEIRHDNQWKPLICRLIGVGGGAADVAVLAPPILLADFPPVGMHSQHLVYSQDVYFLGFPFNLHGNIGFVNMDYPLAYVKKGIVSMVALPGQPHIVIDGHNNPGFSGGPVVFRNDVGLDPGWCIAGVISGYSETREPVYVGDSEAQSVYTIAENSGLVDATRIEEVLALIRANPMGFPKSV
jgi:hypothetical protein